MCPASARDHSFKCNQSFAVRGPWSCSWKVQTRFVCTSSDLLMRNHRLAKSRHQTRIYRKAAVKSLELRACDPDPVSGIRDNVNLCICALCFQEIPEVIRWPKKENSSGTQLTHFCQNTPRLRACQRITTTPPPAIRITARVWSLCEYLNSLHTPHIHSTIHLSKLSSYPTRVWPLWVSLPTSKLRSSPPLLT